MAAPANTTQREPPPIPEGFKLVNRPATPAARPRSPVPPIPQGFRLVDPRRAAAPAAEEDGSFLPEAGKGIAGGAVDATGSAIVGAAGQNAALLQSRIDNAKARIAIMDAIDRGEDVPQQQTIPATPDWNSSPGAGAVGLGTSLADDELDTANVYKTLTPEQQAEFRASQQRVIDTAVNPGEAVEPLARAGAAVKDWGAETFKATKDYEDSFTRQFTEGLGSIVPFAAASIAGAPAIGMATGSFMSSGEAMERAVAGGANKEQLIEAIKLGGLPGLTEQVPVEALFAKVPLPAMGRFTGAVVRVLGQAAVEGGQEAAQQAAQNLIERYTYDPDQDITEGVLEAALLGAAVGGGVKGVMPSTYAKPAKPSTDEPAADNAGTLPEQEQPAAPPAEPPLPEGFKPIENAVEHVEGSDSAPAGPVTDERASPPATPSPAAISGEMREILRRAGNTDDMIDAMSAEEAEAEAGQYRAVTPSAAVQGTPTPARPADNVGIAPATPQERKEVLSELPIAPPLSTRGGAPGLSTRRGLATDASRGRPAEIEAAPDLDIAGQRVNTEPTEAQKEAGNYKKAHVRIAGLDVAIENPKGSTRRGLAPDGIEWQSILPAHYGYFKNTAARSPDGEPVDVYVGDNPSSKKIYIVDQRGPSDRGRFDELKVLLGMDNIQQAKETYARAFTDGTGYQRLGAISAVTPKQLRDLLASPHGAKTAFRYGKERLTEAGFPADTQGRTKRPPSLTEFIAQAGGIRDHGGELAAMDAGKIFLPGVGKLVRQNGRTLDQARALAVENGYLQDAAAGEQSTSTVDDLLVALRDDIGTYRHFSTYDDDWAGSWRDEQAATEGARREEGARARAEAELDEIGLTRDSDPQFYDRALEMVVNGMDVADALERAAVQMDVAENVVADDTPATPYFFDEEPSDAVHARTTPESGTDAGDAGVEGERPEEAGGIPAIGEAPQARGEGSEAEPDYDGALTAALDSEFPPLPEGFKLVDKADESKPETEPAAQPDDMPTFYGEMSPRQQKIFDAAKPDDRDIALKLGAMIDRLDIAGNHDRADALYTKLEGILEAIGVLEHEVKGAAKPATAKTPPGAKMTNPATPAEMQEVMRMLKDPKYATEDGFNRALADLRAAKKGQSSMFGEVTDKEKAQAQADKPLRAKAAQKDVGGLFGDDSKQTDLMDLPGVQPKAIEKTEPRAEPQKNRENPAIETADVTTPEAKAAKASKPEKAETGTASNPVEKINTADPVSISGTNKSGGKIDTPPAADFTDDDIPAFLKKGKVDAQIMAQTADRPVARLIGDELGIEFRGPEDMPALRRAAQDWYDANLRGTTATMSDGTVVAFNQRGRNESTNRKGDVLLRAVPAIRSIIEKGEIVERREGSKRDVIEHLVIAAPVELTGDLKRLAVSVQRMRDGTFHYDFHTDRRFAGGLGIGAQLAPSEARDSLESAASDLNLVELEADSKPPMGWDFAGDMPVPTLSDLQMLDVANIVQRVSGLDEVHFRSILEIPGDSDAARVWGESGEGTLEAAGLYSGTVNPLTGQVLEAVIAVSMRAPGDGRQTAFHEAFHHVQTAFLTEQERALLRAARPHLEAIVAMKRHDPSRMSQKEIEAEAFAIWSDIMETDGAAFGVRLHIGIRRAWARLQQMFERVRNYLRGQGFQTWEDVFETARTGKTKARADKTAAEIDRAKKALRSHGIDPDTPENYAYIDERDYISLAEELVPGFKSKAPKPAAKDGWTYYQVMPTAEELARVPAKTPPRALPGALVTQRINRVLRHGVANLKRLNNRDRRHADDNENALDYVTRKWSDYLLPVLRMQQATGVKLNELNDAYLNARLAEDAALAQIQTMHDTYVKPMVEALASAGVQLEDFHRYLYALHAEERNRVVGERNQPGTQLHNAISDPAVVGASGMSTNEANTVLDGFRKDVDQYRAMRQAGAYVRAMIDVELRNQKRTGLISEETYDLLTTQWKNYIPLKGQDGQDDGGFWKQGKSGFDVRGQEYKTALGRFSEAENVIAHAILQNEQSIIRQHKNTVGKAALRFINQFDPAGEHIADVYWGGEEGFADILKTKEVRKRVIGKDGKVEFRTVPNPIMREDDVLAAKVGGKTFWIRFHDPKVGMALRKMSKAEIGAFSKMVRPITILQSIVNTRANPAFTPINIIRDVATGGVHLLDEGFSTAQIAGIMTNIPKAWGALWRHSRGKAAKGEWDDIVKEYFDAGGKITFHGYADLEGTLKKLQKQVAEGIAGKNKAKAVWDALISFIGDLNDAGENGIRLAAYAAARKQGRTAKQGAFMARDLTVDFKKHGELGPAMNSWFVFFNAALQGNVNIVARMARSKKVQAAVGMFIAVGLMQHFWNSMMAGDDDDGENYYRKMLLNEPWKLERQFVFFIPGTEKYVSFPMPYGYNAFHHFGVQGGAIMTGDASPAAGLLNSMRVWFDAFNPIGSGSLISMISPTITDPIVDLYTNQNFAGAPIYPSENPFDNAPDPKSQRAFSSTHPAFKTTAEWLNWLSGGSEVEPGAVDVYPDALEHLWGFVTGGLGRFAAQVGQTASGAVSGEIVPKKVPYVRSFYGEIDNDSKRTEYFRERERVLAVEGYLKAYGERGDSESVRRFRERNAVELRALGAFKAAEKQRRAINKERRRIEGAKMPEAQRAKALESLDKREAEAMRMARTAFSRAEGQ